MNAHDANIRRQTFHEAATMVEATIVATMSASRAAAANGSVEAITAALVEKMGLNIVEMLQKIGDLQRATDGEAANDG